MSRSGSRVARWGAELRNDDAVVDHSSGAPMSSAQELQNDLVILEPASEANVDLLVRWTLDPVAQGPYKQVPEMSAAQLRELFLHEQSREYFAIRLIPDRTPVGRLYWRAWRFTSDPDLIDWELNIL